MIRLITPLRKKFALLDPELQMVLLKDLGFLTLETEYDQYKFVSEILSLPEDGRKVFLESMKKKQESGDYKRNTEKFEEQFGELVIPKMRIILDEEKKKVEVGEKVTLEKDMDQILDNI